MLAIGDIAERVLQFFGVTKERVQAVTGSKDCGCSKRQAAMNEWGYRWQRWLLFRLWVPVAYGSEMFYYRICHSRVGYAAMHLRMAMRALIRGR